MSIIESESFVQLRNHTFERGFGIRSVCFLYFCEWLDVLFFLRWSNSKGCGPTKIHTETDKSKKACCIDQQMYACMYICNSIWQLRRLYFWWQYPNTAIQYMHYHLFIFSSFFELHVLLKGQAQFSGKFSCWRIYSIMVPHYILLLEIHESINYCNCQFPAFRNK